MSVESERASSDAGADGEFASMSGASLDNSTDNRVGVEGSPELLRTRADSLLDEMMLGAVDVSAADTGAKASNSATYPSGNGYAPRANGSHPTTSEYGYASENGGYSSVLAGANEYSAADESTHSLNGVYGQSSLSSSSTANGDASAEGYGFEPEVDVPHTAHEWRVMSGGGTGNGGEDAWNDYVSSYRAPASSSSQIQKWQPNSPADGYQPESNTPVASNGQMSEPAQGAGTSYGASNSYGVTPAGAGDTPAGTGYVSAMAVMSRGPRRSSLLPRMSRFDVDALNREIAELHEQIRSLLPVGHDQSERARHLLDKANTIAQSDPERSAEVEYYMQQVRTIVERTGQSRRWSNLYRHRLRTYLLAWALLSLMTLTALLMAQFQIEAIVAGMTSAAADAGFMRNFAGGLAAIMAGALGSALGSLINMRRHARSQYGFFDRKYGLRGLMLPLLGALVGFTIYAVFAVVYHFAGINPSLSVIAMAIPAGLAFIFGYSQESLYGTNG